MIKDFIGLMGFYFLTNKYRFIPSGLVWHDSWHQGADSTLVAALKKQQGELWVCAYTLFQQSIERFQATGHLIEWSAMTFHGQGWKYQWQRIIPFDISDMIILLPIFTWIVYMLFLLPKALGLAFQTWLIKLYHVDFKPEKCRTNFIDISEF